MTDKVQKIRKEVEKIAKSINPFLPDEDGKNSEYEAGRFAMVTQIMQIIDSLQEEPVSEELDEAAMQYGTDEFPSLCNGCKHVPIDAFKAGAQWQKKKITNKAVKWFEDNYTITFSKTSNMPSEEGMRRCLVDIENFYKTL